MARKFWVMKKSDSGPDREVPRVYIREHRLLRGWRQKDLLERLAAHGLDTTEASLSRYETGDQPIETSLLLTFAAAFGLTDIEDLFIEPPPKGTNFWDWKIAQLNKKLTAAIQAKERDAKK